MDTTGQPPTILSLCSGYGGLELALNRIFGETKVLAYVEIETFAIANLVDKMETGSLVPAPIWSDLKTFPVEPFRDRVDIITGGYPCQPFSAAGKRLGEDDPRHLFPYIKKIITGVRPVWCFFENVEGHITLGLRTVLADLEEMGYETTWGVFSAAEVGAPHQRKRVFILAHLSSEELEWSEGSSIQRGSKRSTSDDIEKLADRMHERCKCASNEKRFQPEQIAVRSGESGAELAHHNSIGLERRQRELSEQETGKNERNVTGCGEDLAHTHQQGSQKCRNAGGIQQKSEKTCSTIAGGCDKWPARPGEEQYLWEEPRVI